MRDSRAVDELIDELRIDELRGAIRGGQTVSTIDPYVFSLTLSGAEGEGEGEGGDGEGGGDGGDSGGEGGGEGASSKSTDDDSSGSGGSGGSGDSDDDQDTFDRAYVEKLRKEAAENRVRAKKAEEELEEKKKAEMSELERAQAERDKALQEAEEANQTLRRTRLESAVTSSAQAANFFDPEDALSLLDESEISVNDEGIPNKQSVDAAIERLAKKKPHLVRSTSSGSGDGGARGAGGGTVDEEKEKDLNEEFKQRGGVPFPRM